MSEENIPLSGVIEATEEPTQEITENTVEILAPEAPIVETSTSEILTPTSLPSDNKNLFSKKKIAVIGILLLCIFASLAYAFMQKIGPFQTGRLTEKNFTSTMVSKLLEIKSAKYAFSLAIKVVPRDKDAIPLPVGKEEALQQAYAYTNMITPDMKARVAVTASSDDSTSNTDWSFNINLEASGGDVSYKLNADILKKDENIYFKINDFPIFSSFDAFGSFDSIQGKWIVLPINTATDLLEPMLGKEETEKLINGEASETERQEIIQKAIKKISILIDSSGLIVFKNQPRKEGKDGENMIRYDISLNKEALTPLIKKVMEELTKDPDFSEYMEKIPQENKEKNSDIQTISENIDTYLQSEEFNQLFEYLEKNSTTSIWTDENDFPAIIENTMKVIPPDTAENLKENQIVYTIRSSLSDINIPITLTAPEDSISWKEAQKEAEKRSGQEEVRGPGQKTLAELQIITGLGAIKILAMGINQKNNSFGIENFPTGSCKSTKDTLFANEDIIQVINGLTGNNMTLATCSSRGSRDNVRMWALSVPDPVDSSFSYCVDSRKQKDSELSTVKRIEGPLAGYFCK